MRKNIIVTLATAGLIAGLWGNVAFAHVVVKPAQAQTAAFQSFSIGVPTEGDSPTVKVRLVVPDNVKHVTPNVKPGWKIDTITQGSGDNASVKEIIWSGGSVPAGQRDEFAFSAQMPAQASTLQWKAYQTYADGKVVSWDQSPTAQEKDDDSATSGPYSETKVVDNLGDTAAAASGSHVDSDTKSGNGRVNVATGIAIVALVLAVIAMTQNGQPATKLKSKK